MKIVIWGLPDKETAYLRKNCKTQFAEEKIYIRTAENEAALTAEMCSGTVPNDAWIVISANANILAKSVAYGNITVAYQPPGESIAIECPVDMIVEGFEEVDYDFLEKIYQRHHGLPWTILETEHLLVRELTLSDMDALFELYSYEGMTDYMEGLYSYEEEYQYQKAYIENMYHFFGYGMWLVFERGETLKLIGRAGVEHREELDGQLELGYAIGTPWQSRGYATEVCVGILQYVKEQLGFETICSLVQPENTASIRVLEKLGFQMEKELVLDHTRYQKFEKQL